MTIADSCGTAQAYHNELVGKVSRLEEKNIKLKKEKVRKPFISVSGFSSLFVFSCVYIIDTLIFICFLVRFYYISLSFHYLFDFLCGELHKDS